MFKKTPVYQQLEFKIYEVWFKKLNICLKNHTSYFWNLKFYLMRSALLTNCSSFLIKWAAKKAKPILKIGKKEPNTYLILSPELAWVNGNKKNKPTINRFNRAITLESLYCKGRFLYLKIVKIDRTMISKFKILG